MNKFVVMIFLILVFSNILYGNEDNLYLYNCENFVNLCMAMWTKLDLIQAINATYSQKEATIEELIVDSNRVFQESKKIKTLWLLFNSFEIASIVSLVESVKMVFQEVFYDIENQSFNQVILLLGESINLLKAPDNINPVITT